MSVLSQENDFWEQSLSDEQRTQIRTVIVKMAYNETTIEETSLMDWLLLTSPRIKLMLEWEKTWKAKFNNLPDQISWAQRQQSFENSTINSRKQEAHTPALP